MLGKPYKDLTWETTSSEDSSESEEPRKVAAPDLPVWHDGEQWLTKIKVNYSKKIMKMILIKKI